MGIGKRCDKTLGLTLGITFRRYKSDSKLQTAGFGTAFPETDGHSLPQWNS